MYIEQVIIYCIYAYMVFGPWNISSQNNRNVWSPRSVFFSGFINWPSSSLEYIGIFLCAD